MATIAKWGNKKWTVSSSKVLKPDDISFSYTQKADDNQALEDQSLTNLRGTELFPLTFTTVLVAAAGIDVREEIDDWKDLVTAVDYFYLNNKKLGPKLQLRKVSVSEVKTDDLGRILSAKLTFEFKEYDKKTTSWLGIDAKKVGPTSAEKMTKAANKERIKKAKAKAKKKTIKKGSTVKITGSKYADGSKIPKKVKKKKYKVTKISSGKATLKGLKKKVKVSALSLVK